MYFITDFLDTEDSTNLVADHQPSPESRAKIEAIMKILRGDEDIRIQEIGH